MALLKAGVYTLYSSKGKLRCLVDKSLASFLNDGIRIHEFRKFLLVESGIQLKEYHLNVNASL